MQTSRSYTPLSSILLMPDGQSVNKASLDILIQEGIPVFCMNKKADKYRLISFKTLYENNNDFWQKNADWKFFFAADALEKFREKAAERRVVIEPPPPAEAKAEVEEPPKTEVDQGFGSTYEAVVKMSSEEKIKYLIDNKNKLSNIINNKLKNKSVATEALVDTTKGTVMLNHAALDNIVNLGDEEAKKATQRLVYVTQEMVRLAGKLFSNDVFDNRLMNDLVEKSNGTIVQHMTRVYLNGIAFLTYYNNVILNRATITNLRNALKLFYADYYSARLPQIPANSVTLERVFHKGMLPIPQDLFDKWSIGFLIHDIGKAAAVEYHEGEAEYDRNIVIEHVKLGYNSIISKTNYPREASLITGYHHEYYGDPDGYGYYRDYFNHFKKANPHVTQDYFMTYDMDTLMECKALAYFPAKVLEIVDVYDSFTDPNRIYRKALPPKEALALMRDEFIIKHFKIDPILFEMFSTFIREKEKNIRAKG